jgi:hypothetical protein
MRANPSPPQYRHIVRIANEQLRGQFPQRLSIGNLIFIRQVIRACEGFGVLTIAAMHQGNYATIANYLERELRYMDAGE